MHSIFVRFNPMDARPAPENGDTAVKRIEESGSLVNRAENFY